MRTPSDAPPYQAVDELIRSAGHVITLHAALEVGILDALDRQPGQPGETLAARLELDRRTSPTLLRALQAIEAVEQGTEGLRLSQRCTQAMAHRELLEATLELARRCLIDALQSFGLQIKDRHQYLQRSSLMEFFHYGEEAADRERVATWMRPLSAITRYDAQILMQHIDLRGHRRMLDVGGNSGALALCLCQHTPDLHATVIDRPMVCALGAEMIAGKAGAERVNFQPLDIRDHDLPAGVDLVVFKSTLHDWEGRVARALLQRAHAALRPGGKVLVFERAPCPSTAERWVDRAIWLPLQAWRRPQERYMEMLQDLGFRDVECRPELPREFSLVMAQRP